jgi:hypothetical protein
LLKTSRGRDSLWRFIFRVRFVVKPLPLQIAKVDVITVDNTDSADTRANQRFGLETSQCPATGDTNKGVSYLALPCIADTRKQYLPGIPFIVARTHIGRC